MMMLFVLEARGDDRTNRHHVFSTEVVNENIFEFDFQTIKKSFYFGCLEEKKFFYLFFLNCKKNVHFNHLVKRYDNSF